MYLLYSISRGGWFSRSANYTSDRSEAQQFSRDDALALVQKHKVEAGYNLIPVNEEDL